MTIKEKALRFIKFFFFFFLFIYFNASSTPNYDHFKRYSCNRKSIEILSTNDKRFGLFKTFPFNSKFSFRSFDISNVSSLRDFSLKNGTSLDRKPRGRKSNERILCVTATAAS